MRSTVLSLLMLYTLVDTAAAQPTTFTYQGQLKAGAMPATGVYDFRFRLFDEASGGSQFGTTNCVDDVEVSDGLFTATLDFGQQFASGAARYIEIEVRSDTGLNCANATGFTTLSPRQIVTAAPRAIQANSAFSLAAPNGSAPNAVFVDSAGNVGVGTTVPTVPLHVKAAGQGIRIEGQSAAVNNSAYLAFATGAGTDLGYIGDGASGDNNIYVTSYTGDVILYTAAGASVAATSNGNVGIKTPSPTAALDVRGDIKLGDAGQYHAPASPERLRIVRGVASAAGGLIYGSGCSASRVATGTYRIAFSEPFASVPAVTANAFPTPGQSHGPYVVMISDLSSTSAELKVFWGPTGTLYDCNVSFTAMSGR